MSSKILWLILLLMLVGCGGSGTETDTSAQAVERYLQAKVDGNEEKIRELICAEKESTVAREASSFSSLNDRRIENMSCQRNEGADTVTCTGQIVGSYGAGAEAKTFDLATYRVVQEDGDWKWCGETE